jgi:hypothetical protein
MDENTKLLLELTQRQAPPPPEREPICYDVETLMEETRKRMYTPEGARLVEALRRSELADR